LQDIEPGALAQSMPNLIGMEQNNRLDKAGSHNIKYNAQKPKTSNVNSEQHNEIITVYDESQGPNRNGLAHTTDSNRHFRPNIDKETVPESNGTTQLEGGPHHITYSKLESNLRQAEDYLAGQ